MPSARPILILLPAAVLLALLLRPGAQTQAQGAKPAQFVTYESGAAQWLSAPHTLELSRGVQFGQDDAVLRTDAATALLDDNSNVISAKAAGPVHLFDSQDDLTGRHGSVDFTKHLATLEGGIVLLVKPGKREASAKNNSPRRQFKDPATLTCAAMTYDYRHKVGRVPGPLTVVQNVRAKDGRTLTRTLTADAGLYDGKKETIQLVGTIRGTDSDGNRIEGDTRSLGKPVLINIKEGFEALFAPFKTTGVFPVKPGDGKEDGTDDEPDLTLPTPPAHTPAAAADAPPAPPPAAPPAAAASVP